MLADAVSAVDKHRQSLLPGLLVAAAVAVPALALGRLEPLVGAPVFAIVLGAAVRTLREPRAVERSGVSFAGKRLLQAAIVLLGTGLGLGRVVHVGASSLPVMLGTLAVALGGAALAGRVLRVEPRLRTLVGVGTGICGASAIAAVSGVVDATEAEVAYATTTIFVFNVAAVLLFPALGHLLGLAQRPFGLWAGTAVNDTSSVVAAGYAFGHAAGAYAVIVKLTRTTMIVPVALALGLAARRGAGGRRRLLPGFLVLFLAASAADSVGLVPAAAQPGLAEAARLLIVLALAAIGLSSPVGALRRTGWRPLALGAVLWAAVAGASLLLQALTGTL